MKNLIRYLFFIFGFILAAYSITCLAQKSDEPPSIGNFAVPSSQQPGALVSFGQNVIGKNESQLVFFTDNYNGIRKHFTDLIPFYLYGVTDQLAVLVSAPYAFYNEDNEKSTGFEDVTVQAEYSFYDHQTRAFTEQATVVANISAPTGSINKNPQTGFGGPSLFIGPTYLRTYPDWLFFTSAGAEFPIAHSGTRFGNNYLYQGGIGRNIFWSRDWILSWVTELDGTYAQKDRVKGFLDPDSGGNIVYITPSLWFSTDKIILQFGVGWPVVQHFFGEQTKNTYALFTNFEWKLT